MSPPPSHLGQACQYPLGCAYMRTSDTTSRHCCTGTACPCRLCGAGTSCSAVLSFPPLLPPPSVKQNLQDPALVERLLSRTPLGRLAQPEDVSGGRGAHSCVGYCVFVWRRGAAVGVALAAPPAASSENVAGLVVLISISMCMSAAYPCIHLLQEYMWADAATVAALVVTVLMLLCCLLMLRRLLCVLSVVCVQALSRSWLPQLPPTSQARPLRWMGATA